MAEEVITSLEEVTPAWLTGVLANSGVLTRGSVTTVDVETGGGNWSTHAKLALRYAEGVQGALPQRLFLKMVKTDGGDGAFGPSEVTYYTRDYVDVDEALLVRCYDAAYSEAQRRYHLLLDDLSATHCEAYRKMPTLAYGLALADGLAAMHARWWGAQRLAEAEGPLPNAEHIQRFVAVAAPGVGPILNHFSQELEPHWPDAMRTLYTQHPPAMIARTRDDNGFTLIHGDAGPYNILVPRQGERPLYLIDRQPFAWSLTTWLGVYDLAFAIAIHWDVAIRRALEVPILRHYHDQLLKKGVLGYPWERLWDDYRLSVAMGVYVATAYCRRGVNARAMPYWMPKLKRALTACDDLDCSELW